MALWVMTDEVLTEGKAGWHAGRWKPWRLRGRLEIAWLLHYSITSQGLSSSQPPLHLTTIKVSQNRYNWMQHVNAHSFIQFPATVLTNVKQVEICINQHTAFWYFLYFAKKFKRICSHSLFQNAQQTQEAQPKFYFFPYKPFNFLTCIKKRKFCSFFFLFDSLVKTVTTTKSTKLNEKQHELDQTLPLGFLLIRHA